MKQGKGEGWNVRLKPQRGPELKLGKVVPYRGALIWHYWAQEGDKRRDIDAYGLRKIVLAACRRWGVHRFAVYDRIPDMTYLASRAIIDVFGTAGVTDRYGPTINVPVDNWKEVRGKLDLPYIPEEVYKVVAVHDPGADLSFDPPPPDAPPPPSQGTLF